MKDNKYIKNDLIDIINLTILECKCGKIGKELLNMSNNKSNHIGM